ncbi:MAG: protein serine/threonine phosphatase [Oscillospiraceae bacterium]|nr:protein serine/threonine phosphatase [Oscillospiraceae bacterium]
MNAVGKTDIGKLREMNQDAFFVSELNQNDAFAIVCDGMGGKNGGNVASTMACDMISKKVVSGYRSQMDSNSIRNLLITSVTAANVEVNTKASQHKELEGMGTTAVAVLATSDMAHIVHVGDSRAYLHSADKIVQLTKDHSIVQELVEQGRLSEDDAKNHPKKNLITRAVGVELTVSVDYIELELTKGDSILLCSDGLTNMCSNDELSEVLNTNKPGAACEKLIKIANEHGGVDNITIVIVS